MTVTGFRSALRSVREDDRWCTPSLIDYDAADSRLDDVSVSYARFGSPLEITVEGPYYDDGTDTTLTITGGTGRYTGAEGTMLLHATGNPVGSEYDFIFTLTR